MFEIYEDQEYKPLNKTAKNARKRYENNLKISDKIELKLDISDATIKGHKSQPNHMISTYQLRKNQTNIEADAYLACKSDRFKLGCFDKLLGEDEASTKIEEWWPDKEESQWEKSEIYGILNKGTKN